MQSYFKSHRFKAAIFNTLVTIILFPAILAAVNAIGGNAAMSWDAVRANVWPQTFVFGAVYGAFTIGFGYVLFRKNMRGDDQ